MRQQKCTGVVAIGVMLALALAGCGESEQAAPAAAAPPPAVTVVTIAQEELRPSITFTGRIEATDKVDLRARVDGFLDERRFTEGTLVKQGDLLFVLEKGPYEAAVAQNKAALEKAKAALALADIEAKRQTDLVAQGRSGASAARRGSGQSGRGTRRGG